MGQLLESAKPMGGDACYWSDRPERRVRPKQPLQHPISDAIRQPLALTLKRWVIASLMKQLKRVHIIGHIIRIIPLPPCPLPSLDTVTPGPATVRALRGSCLVPTNLRHGATALTPASIRPGSGAKRHLRRACACLQHHLQRTYSKCPASDSLNQQFDFFFLKSLRPTAKATNVPGSERLAHCKFYLASSLLRGHMNQIPFTTTI